MAAQKQDVNEIRAAILADGGSTSTGAVTAGSSRIHASDFSGLKTGIQGLWTGANLGTLPGWSSGVSPNGGSSSTPIYGSDVVDLRQWLNQYQFAASKSVSGFQYAAGTVVVTNTFYDGRNLKVAESVPHLLNVNVPGQFASGDWSVSANPAITYTYDAVKRPLTRAQPDTPSPSTYSWSYSGFTTTTTDENTHQKTSTVDALGRLVSVVELPGSQYTNGNLTQYGYDVADRLTSVTDAAGNLTQITYDSLGRKLSLVDPNLGTWTYAPPSTLSTVNPLWLVQTQTDYLNQSITFTYDALDRVVTKSGSGLSVSYAYDAYSSSNYGIGHRTSMQDAGSSTPATYAYDQRGRLVSFTRPITGASNAYQISTTYDAMDRLLTITLPNNDILTYVYGDHGQPITLLLNGSPLVNGATYNALLKLKTLPLGNGLTTVYNYFGVDVAGPNANSFYGRLYQIQTGTIQNQTFPASSVNGNNLGYDVVGNPTGIAFADHTAEQLNFSYNPIDELMGMSGSASESYSYAAATNPTTDVANIIIKGLTTLSYPGIKTSGATNHAPYAPASAGAVNYSYDANGNRLSDSTYSYTYDVENHLTALKQGSTTLLQNTYDGDGQRLIRVANGTTTHYVGDWFENNPTTGVPTVYYAFNGKPVAMKSGASGTLTYLHQDHLGSLVLATSTAGVEIGSARYMPYGSQRSASSTETNPTGLPSDRLFTGQIRDLGNDVFYFFKSRYFDATTGKFHTPDTIVPGAGNPRTLNRYAYGLNNPLKMVDPSGHFTQDQLLAWGYTQAQISAWSKVDPNWAAIVAAAQVGDVVTGLNPFTSGSPQQVTATFTLLSHAGQGHQQLVLADGYRYADLADFGVRVNQDRMLWRFDRSTANYQFIQTPQSFLRAPEPGDTLIVPESNWWTAVGSAIHAPARWVRGNVTGYLDMLSPGPTTAQEPMFGIGLSSAAEAASLRFRPEWSGDGGTVAAVAQLIATAYDVIYGAAYHD